MSQTKPAFSESSSFATRSSRTHVEKKKKYDRVITKAQLAAYQKEKGATKKIDLKASVMSSVEGISVVNSLDYKLEPFSKKGSSPTKCPFDLNSLPIDKLKAHSSIRTEEETISHGDRKGKKYTEILTKHKPGPDCVPQKLTINCNFRPSITLFDM